MIETPRIFEAPALLAAAIRLNVSGQDMSTHMDPAIAELLMVLATQGHVPTGPLFSYHHRRPSETFDFEIAFPVATPIMAHGRVHLFERPACRVVNTVYVGPYDGLREGWKALQEWVREQHLPETGRFWESYLTNPDDEPDPAKWRTELNWVLE
jgi:effector-binding domain-containing protein